MCGIAGWFSQNPNIENPKTILQNMAAAIAHRGPDGNDIYTSQHVGFAHTRLAIIDINGGKQPMLSKDKQLAITFNGEIYNYQSLRNELISKGRIFHTNSDTEVILQLYQQYGWHGFNRLRGMYAFAIWDATNKTGLLVRDPIGIKPLFVSTLPDKNLVFGSEAKAILAYSSSTSEIEPSSLHLLLNFRYLPGDITMFKNIKQLSPGNVFIWHANGKQETHKLEPSFPNENSNLLDELTEAVDLHCTSDVEVGAYLSGGIDSAAICALAKRSGRKLRSFTLDTGDDPYEADNAAETAKLLNIENVRMELSVETDDLSRLIKHLEVPKVNAYQVSRLASHTAQHVKVTLSGLGADELFYGYNAHQIYSRAHQINRYIPSQIAHGVAKIGSSFIEKILPIQWTEPQRALLMLGASRNWSRVYGLLRNIWDSPSMRKVVYGPRLLDATLPDSFTMLESLWPSHDDPVKAMALFEWNNKMVNDLLWQEDRVSMAEGLEVRVPFLDLKFASHVKQMEREELMPRDVLKGYMKNMLSNELPSQILNRQKSGFQVNAPVFVKNSLKPLTDLWLSPERIEHYGLFNPKFCKKHNETTSKKMVPLALFHALSNAVNSSMDCRIREPKVKEHFGINELDQILDQVL